MVGNLVICPGGKKKKKKKCCYFYKSCGVEGHVAILQEVELVTLLVIMVVTVRLLLIFRSLAVVEQFMAYLTIYG